MRLSPLLTMRSGEIRAYRCAAHAVAAWLAAMAVTSSSSAFCRTTTCDPKERMDCQVDADGCARAGVALYWLNATVSMSIAGGSVKRGISDSEAQQTLSKALGLWTSADCGGSPPSIAVASVDLVPVGSTRQSLQTEVAPDGGHPWDQTSALIFRDDSWGDKDPTAIALTSVLFGTTTGHILEADIEVNSVSFSVSTTSGVGTYNLHDILGHETGHFFGLAHSEVPGSIMRTQYSFDLTPHETVLAADDVAGICAVYPPGRFVDSSGCACRQAGYSRRSSGASAFLVTLVVAARLLRRRGGRLLRPG